MRAIQRIFPARHFPSEGRGRQAGKPAAWWSGWAEEAGGITAARGQPAGAISHSISMGPAWPGEERFFVRRGGLRMTRGRGAAPFDCAQDKRSAPTTERGARRILLRSPAASSSESPRREFVRQGQRRAKPICEAHHENLPRLPERLRRLWFDSIICMASAASRPLR